MRNNLLEIIAEILKIEVAELETSISEREIWDSLKKVEILFAIEDEYSIMFEEEELSDLDTPEKVILLTMKKVGNK